MSADFKCGDRVLVHIGGKDKTPVGYPAHAAGYGSIDGNRLRAEVDGSYFDFPAAWIEPAS